MRHRPVSFLGTGKPHLANGLQGRGALAPTVLVITLRSVPSHEIVELVSVVTPEVVFGIGLVAQFMAEWANYLGSRLTIPATDGGFAAPAGGRDVSRPQHLHLLTAVGVVLREFGPEAVS